jgi:DNA polymerase-3 subunit alpha
VRDKYFNKINCTIDIQKIKPETVKLLGELGKKYPGNCNLYIQLIDHQDEQSLQLISTKAKIEPNNEVLALLDTNEISYKLN